MKNLRFSNCNELEDFLKANKSFEFEFETKKDKYKFIDKTLKKLAYWSLSKNDKGTVIRCLKLLTGYKRSQLMVLIKQSWQGELKPKEYKRNKFSVKYTDYDISLLAKTDEVHLRLNAGATQEILKRQYKTFDQREYENISRVSVSHIYNLRDKGIYKTEYQGLNYTKTNPVKVSIGERRKPEPNGKPGYIRIDSVHQGDLDKEKGVYHINSIDEVTQWEIVGCVEKISYDYLLPLLKDMVKVYPFKIIEFHTDNGSEYINHQVADMLNRLIIKLTKSRARRSNDNALVETKNGSVIRKHMGYVHISGNHAGKINRFYMNFFNLYLNYHRPCGYAEEKIVGKYGKTKKVYNEYIVPYEKLKSLKNAEEYLKEGLTFEELDKIAYGMSDNEAAKLMQNEKDKLFQIIFKKGENI